MQQEILINWSPQETRVAVIENGAVQELHLERSLERGLVGNVYLGKVTRVLPGIQSAFVNIGMDRAAFLHVGDLMSTIAARHTDGADHKVEGTHLAPPAAIEKQVFEGQTLLVQVIKDPLGTKGARLSTQISIAGRQLVYLPQDNHIGVSQKIPLEHRHALKERVKALAKADNPQASTGFILRTNAEDASDDELLEDIAYLRRAWDAIALGAKTMPPLTLVHRDLSLLERVLRDLVHESTQLVRIDSKEQFQNLQAFGRRYMPRAVQKLAHYTGERPIFDLFAVDDEINKALGRRVDLKSGGYLIIDQTEALTTVDVNTGAYVGARNFDDTIYKTNLEASQAIARQLRLRNLGGIIIIDFIDMVRPDHREAVMTELKKQLAYDRVKTMTSGYSQLGLVEMTRKRTRESLAHVLSELCPVCEGKGLIKTVRTVAYDILREILRQSRQFNPKEIRIIAAPPVIDIFLDEESQHLAELSDFIKKPISLQVETAMAQDHYDVVLL